MPALTAAPGERSASRVWMRALEKTAPIAKNPTRLLMHVLEEQAAQRGAQPAILSDAQSYTYEQLVARVHQFAHWARLKGMRKGDVVGLLAPNSPEYFALWAGVSSQGVIVALVNTQLQGESLRHCVHAAQPKLIVAHHGLAATVNAALAGDPQAPEVVTLDGPVQGFRSIEQELATCTTEPPLLLAGESVTIRDCALYIYTSGTTGFPKAARVTHARILQWAHWFAGMMEVTPQDRMYSCLPMYHSIGGVLVPGAMLAGGGSLVVREKFSASQFWDDLVRWDCTIFQYIGEFCRYLLQAADQDHPPTHSIRLACGNGLSAGVWAAFQERFAIPQILEFYAATEGNISLFNAEGKPGALGRVPPYLAHRFSPQLIRIDPETQEPARDASGLCIRCASSEAGEAIGKVLEDPSAIGSRFDGYTDVAATERKILRNVFAQGDCWVRTGDLMRKDEQGFYYFVDRLGDTFRWKGENVATSEVEAVLASLPGVVHANVYGVQVPGCEGQAGMAALVLEDGVHLQDLREAWRHRLPGYACPLFFRIVPAMDLTGTFKYSKSAWRKQGIDPSLCADDIYMDHPEKGTLVPMDQDLYGQIQRGEIRL
ncbi:MAG: long-chain-acyl-CoA synthetase [Terracidiphilus sp.]